MQKIFSSMMAAMGRQLKHSVNVFHSFTLYRRLPEQNAEIKQSSTNRVEEWGQWCTFIIKAVDPVDGGALVVAA